MAARPQDDRRARFQDFVVFPSTVTSKQSRVADGLSTSNCSCSDTSTRCFVSALGRSARATSTRSLVRMLPERGALIQASSLSFV